MLSRYAFEWERCKKHAIPWLLGVCFNEPYPEMKEAATISAHRGVFVASLEEIASLPGASQVSISFSHDGLQQH